MAIAVRAQKHIQGIEINGMETKLLQFADLNNSVIKTTVISEGSLIVSSHSHHVNKLEVRSISGPDEKKLDAFLHKSLHRILKIYWPMRITNEEIRARAGMETISKQVARRRWTWLGHILRMDHHSYPRIALTWVPEGKWKRGRPRETWRRTVERELEKEGLRTWAAAASAAEDRTAWRQRAYGPILHLENG